MMNESAAPAFQVENLHKNFGTLTAVNNVTISIERGEIVALLGANGAGKTTTLDIALGLQKADSGNAHLFGLKPRTAIRAGMVGAIAQSDGLIKESSPRATLRQLAATFQSPRNIDELIAETGLTSFAKKAIGKLSGGQVQRLRLAIGLLPNPQILLADEPTSGMDVSARQEFWALMKTQAEHGCTIIFATHYLQEAEDYSQRTIIMNEGKVVADGSTAQVRAQVGKQHLRVEFPDDSSTNIAKKIASELCAKTNLEWTFNCDANILTATGNSIEPLAAAMLSVEGAKNSQLHSASLEDTFLSLTRKTGQESSAG